MLCRCFFLSPWWKVKYWRTKTISMEIKKLCSAELKWWTWCIPCPAIKCMRLCYNATLESFGTYIQTYANQECKWKCILMLNYWVMHNSKSLTDVVTRKHMKAILCDRCPIFQVANLNRNPTQFRHSEIHYLWDPTARNGSLDMWQPEMWRTYLKCVSVV